jgi:hypothetical protein
MAELGSDCDPFMLHIYAAFAERQCFIIAARTKAALAAAVLMLMLMLMLMLRVASA